MHREEVNISMNPIATQAPAPAQSSAGAGDAHHGESAAGAFSEALAGAQTVLDRANQVAGEHGDQGRDRAAQAQQDSHPTTTAHDDAPTAQQAATDTGTTSATDTSDDAATSDAVEDGDVTPAAATDSQPTVETQGVPAATTPVQPVAVQAVVIAQAASMVEVSTNAITVAPAQDGPASVETVAAPMPEQSAPATTPVMEETASSDARTTTATTTPVSMPEAEVTSPVTTPAPAATVAQEVEVTDATAGAKSPQVTESDTTAGPRATTPNSTAATQTAATPTTAADGAVAVPVIAATTTDEVDVDSPAATLTTSAEIAAKATIAPVDDASTTAAPEVAQVPASPDATDAAEPESKTAPAIGDDAPEPTATVDDDTPDGESAKGNGKHGSDHSKVTVGRSKSTSEDGTTTAPKQDVEPTKLTGLDRAGQVAGDHGADGRARAAEVQAQNGSSATQGSQDAPRPASTDQAAAPVQTTQTHQSGQGTRTSGLPAEAHLRLSEQRIEHIANQLAARMRLSQAAGGTQVHLALRPRELGDVHVSLSVQNGAVVANVAVDRAETGRLLQLSADELKRALNESGLDVQQFSVDVRDGDAQATWAHADHGSSSRGSASNTGGAGHAAGGSEAADASDVSGAGDPAGELHDGNVSVLV